MAVVIDDKVIGDLFVIYTSMQETVEIGYTFSKDFRGKGYAKEAVYALIATVLDQYNIHRIVANLDARNTSSANLCERLGMRKEAHFIQDYWSKGEWTDSLIYAMLASEFDTNI
ncbi:GNAT family protein [Aerococcus sp.]|uniref:GNAT family N-acetyltransferase n=1 Tax=Aerococcus sp. TaxID=1872398 RepID=UPI0025B8CBDB|nr:GNAT family protein [Aerococcus sp.]MBR2130720.1 GNAT family N-acetyltransferase [Aerococcus sp.]